jgi:Ran-binding protein 1
MSTPEEKPAATAAPTEADKVHEDNVDDSKLKLPTGVKMAGKAEKTHEEEEVQLWKMRCAIYRFDVEANEWKERGKGDVKILLHPDMKKVRLVMRQEKNLHVRANHVIDPNADLEANAGSEKSWVYRAMDFSDEELKETLFAIRFGTVEKAKAFAVWFKRSQEVNGGKLSVEDVTALIGKDGDEATGASTKAAEAGAGGDKAVEAAAAAVEAVKVSEEAPKEEAAAAAAPAPAPAAAAE